MDEIVQRLKSIGRTIERVGNQYRTLCPFHNETEPSFYFTEQGEFKCFGCGVGGKVGTFIKLWNERYGENNSDPKPLPKSKRKVKSWKEYLDGLPDCSVELFMRVRGLHRELAERMIEIGGLKFDPEMDAIVIPYFMGKEVILVRWRKLEGEPKYLQPPKTKSHLYFPTGRMELKGQVFICEGELDALLLQSLGFNAVGVPGVGNVGLLRALEFNPKEVEFYLVFDNDTAGIKASKLVQTFFPLFNLTTKLPPGRDVGEVIRTRGDVEALLPKIKKRKDLLWEIMDYLDRVIVGESETKLGMTLVLASSFTDNLLSAVLKGNSAAGKSYISGTVASLFPGRVEMISRLTQNALFYLSTLNLSHKHLMVAELPGLQDGYYAVRTLLSEGRLRLWVPQKDGDKIETTEIIVEGPTGIVITTVEAELEEQDETRLIELFVNESKYQTERILAYQAKKAAGKVESADEEREYLINRIKNLAEGQVVIPYAEKIKFPIALRSRRDFPKLLSLIGAAAVLSQESRATEMAGDKLIIEATLDDFYYARTVIKHTLMHSQSHLSPRAEELLGYLRDKELEEFTFQDLREWMKNAGLSPQQVNGLVQTLVKNVYAERVVEFGVKKYRLVNTDQLLNDEIAIKEED